MTKRKRTNNDLQSITHKSKDRITYSYIKLREQIRQNDIGNICATSGAGTAYLSGASVFTIGF
jgi:hypothetical protein